MADTNVNFSTNPQNAAIISVALLAEIMVEIRVLNSKVNNLLINAPKAGHDAHAREVAARDIEAKIKSLHDALEAQE